MELLTIATNIKAAKCPEDIFGGPPDGSTVTPVYRQLILVIHPDHFDGKPTELATATEAFRLLAQLRGEAERKIKAGKYGQKKVKAPPPKEPFRPSVVEANGKRYILTDQVASGDLCDIFLCTISNGSADHKAIFKIVKNGADNDLVENEIKVLAKLHAPGVKFDERFFPKTNDSFVIRGPGFQRQVNVLSWFPEHRGLDEVLRVFPDGIDYRDMVWMFKRILHGVGFAHENQIVHGALIPPHILIHPVDHGAKIIDWSYAVDITPKVKAVKPKTHRSLYDLLDADDILTPDPHVKAISADYKLYYPPEILKKEIPTPASDIYMAAKCAVALVGGDLKTNAMPNEIPGTVRAFFERCLHAVPAKRPQNMWDAHEELDRILKAAVGKRTYRPFPMPEVRP